MKTKNIYLAYGLALILFPLGIHRLYMGHQYWWQLPAAFGIGVVSSMGDVQHVATVMTALVWFMFLWDLTTMWQWPREFNQQ